MSKPTWFAESKEAADLIYVANDPENLPIASPIYPLQDDDYGGKFKFAQRALGDGACYFNSAIIAILNDCVDSKENWNQFRTNLLDKGCGEIADKIGVEDAVLTREHVNQLLQVRNDENIVKQLTLILVVPLNESFCKDSLVRVKKQLGPDLIRNSDEEYLDISKKEWMALKGNAYYYQQYVGECTQYRNYEVSVDGRCIAATYSEIDLEQIVKSLYFKQIVTVDQQILLNIELNIEPDSNSIYMFNPGGHFDVLYPDLDRKIQSDLLAISNPDAPPPAPNRHLFPPAPPGTEDSELKPLYMNLTEELLEKMQDLENSHDVGPKDSQDGDPSLSGSLEEVEFFHDEGEDSSFDSVPGSRDEGDFLDKERSTASTSHKDDGDGDNHFLGDQSSIDSSQGSRAGYFSDDEDEDGSEHSESDESYEYHDLSDFEEGSGDEFDLEEKSNEDFKYEALRAMQEIKKVSVFDNKLARAFKKLEGKNEAGAESCFEKIWKEELTTLDRKSLVKFYNEKNSAKRIDFDENCSMNTLDLRKDDNLWEANKENLSKIINFSIDFANQEKNKAFTKETISAAEASNKRFHGTSSKEKGEIEEGVKQFREYQKTPSETVLNPIAEALKLSLSKGGKGGA